MSLCLLKFEPDMAGLTRWAERAGLLSRRVEDDIGYALHALLAAAFGVLSPKPFVLLRDPSRPAALLAYCGDDPEALRDHASAFADPDVCAALGIATMAAKAMPERFAVGRRLGFGLRARPTVRADRDGDRTRVREVDAFLAAVTGTAKDAGPERGAVYRDWLSRHLAEGGAELERLTLDGFRLSDTLRRGQDRSLRPQRGPDASFSGVLRVIDSDRFAAMLGRGVGRHRAFGYGMMLLRPA